MKQDAKYRWAANQSGFGLIQTMMGVAIMGITMLGFASMMTIMGRNQKTQDSRASFNTLNGSIRSQLLMKQTCLSSFSSGVPNMAAVTAATITPISLSIPPNTIAAGQYLEDYRLLIELIRIRNYQPFGIVAGPIRYHFADVMVSASTDKLSSQDIQPGIEDRFQFNETIAARLIIESNPAGVVQSCYAVDESVNILQLIESFCASMGLTYSNGQCLIDPRVRALIAQAGVCPAGTYVGGFTGSGTVSCVTLPSPPPPPVAAGSCPPGQSVTGLGPNGPSCAPTSPLANVNCQQMLVAANCDSQPAVVGFDANGAPICYCVPRSGSCFTAETKIRMADGSEKTIDSVQVGDWVQGGFGQINQVKGVEIVPLGSRRLFGINGGHRFFTEEHPFATHEGWKSMSPEATAHENPNLFVETLQSQDYLRTEKGWQRLQTVESGWLPAKTKVYNLLLTDDHSYIANGFVVHNKH